MVSKKFEVWSALRWIRPRTCGFATVTVYYLTENRHLRNHFVFTINYLYPGTNVSRLFHTFCMLNLRASDESIYAFDTADTDVRIFLQPTDSLLNYNELINIEHHNNSWETRVLLIIP